MVEEVEEHAAEEERLRAQEEDAQGDTLEDAALDASVRLMTVAPHAVAAGDPAEAAAA